MPQSEGLARARAAGVATSAAGIDWVVERAAPGAIIFDATSAAAHRLHALRLSEAGLQSVDLTPAEVGRRKAVGGQEDMILEVGAQLAGRSSS